MQTSNLQTDDHKMEIAMDPTTHAHRTWSLDHFEKNPSSQDARDRLIAAATRAKTQRGTPLQTTDGEHVHTRSSTSNND